MTDILNIGRLLQTDADGYIISESDISKINSPWKEAVEEIKEAYINNLGDALHSIYVRGTVSRGEAIAGISDIDTFAVLNRAIHKGDRAWFRETAATLEKKYSFCTDIELNLSEYEQVMDEEKGFNDRFLIKTQSACIYGKDLRENIHDFKTDIQTASHFHRDLPFFFEKAIVNMHNNPQPEEVQSWCRWIMKRIIRAAFILVMDKEQKFTRDLYPSYEIFSKYYPEKEPSMKEALNLAINPSGKVEEVESFIKDFGYWVEREIENKFK